VLSNFWDAIGGKLADRWAAVATPALPFWLGGLLAWAYHRGGLYQLTTLTNWLDRQTTITQLTTVLAVLLGVAASSLLVDRLTTPVLRLLEGYWPAWFAWLRRPLLARLQRRAAAEDAAWQQLVPDVLEHPATATADQLATFARLDQRRRRRPKTATRYLPTRIGNVLRAAETWPADKYGLDAVAIWPRLWLLLPDSARQELLAARTALDGVVAVAIWGLLFCIFAIWMPIAIPIGLVVATAAIRFWAPTRAEIFGDLLEAAYDLHRTTLYQQLRWPLPTDPKQEHTQGEQLSSYLWRGSDDPDPTFTPPP
jgi:hypothetical protein